MLKNKGQNAITLIALVITIIVMLILAGVGINLTLGENGIFNRAKVAKEKTQMEQAREKLELVFAEAQIEKQTEPKYTQDEYLDEMMENRIQNIKINGDSVIVDGFTFEIDRSVPKIDRYLGKEENLTFPKISISTPDLSEDCKTATFIVTAKDQSGISKIELRQNGQVIETFEYTDLKTEINQSCTVKRNGTYTIRVYSNLIGSERTKVEGIVSEIEFSPNGNETYKKEHQVKVMVKETQEGIKSLKYQWTTTSEEPTEESKFTEECTNGSIITKKDVTGIYYLWMLLETDKGKKNICGSEAFYFDNVAPTGEITTEWIEESSGNKLNVSVNNITDNLSKINSVKLYIETENGNKEEKNITISDGAGSIILDGINIESTTEITLIVTDNAGNQMKKKKNVGRQYLVRNGVSYFKESNTSRNV